MLSFIRMANNDRLFNLNTKLPNHDVDIKPTSSCHGNSNSAASPNPRKRKQEMVHSSESSFDTSSSNIPGNELSKYKSNSLSTAVNNSIGTQFTVNSPIQQSHILTNAMRQKFLKSYETTIQAIIQISDWSKEYITDCLLVLKSAGQEINRQSLWQKCEDLQKKLAFQIHRNQLSYFDNIHSNAQSSAEEYDRNSAFNQDNNASFFGGHSKCFNHTSKKCRSQMEEGKGRIDGAVKYHCDSIPDSDETCSASAPVLTCNDPQCDSQDESHLVTKSEHIKKLLSAVENEHKLLLAYKHCLGCGTNPREITFLPCGHFVACKSCAVLLFACPSCNGSIFATVDTYLS